LEDSTADIVQMNDMRAMLLNFNMEPMDWLSLDAGQLIGDCPIRKYLHGLTRDSTACAAADPQFWVDLTSNSGESDLRVCLPPSWRTVPILAVPIFTGNRNSGHWTALIIDRRSNPAGDLIHFDSNGISSGAPALSQDVCRTLQKTPLWKTASTFTTAKVPQQQSNDCGAWMCAIIATYSISHPAPTGTKWNRVATTFHLDPKEAGEMFRLAIRNVSEGENYNQLQLLPLQLHSAPPIPFNV
jgi:hypothetical protein